MDENKLIEYLKINDTTSGKTLFKSITHETDIGNLLIYLLYKAENGDFHEIKKPEMVRFCDTKYAYYKNNYDNCSIEEIIGCDNCEYYIPKFVLELFEKFEKDGFPTDEELDRICGKIDI